MTGTTSDAGEYGQHLLAVRSGGSDGAEDAPTGAPFLCLKCRLNSAGWLIIFLYQNQAAYLSSSCNPAKDEHIFASLSLSCVQAFSLRYIVELLA